MHAPVRPMQNENISPHRGQYVRSCSSSQSSFGLATMNVDELLWLHATARGSEPDSAVTEMCSPESADSCGDRGGSAVYHS